jgi:hypothetical protein
VTDLDSGVAELLSLVGDEPDAFTPAEVLHPGQIAAESDESATVVIVAGRRWGKSTVALYKGLKIARRRAGVTCVIIGATQGSLSRNFWRPLHEMNRDYGLGCVFLKGVEGWSATLPNGSQLIFLPVDTEEAADKARGLSNVAFVCVDESQRYKSNVLSYLVLDVLKAMFIDLRVKGQSAQLWLMGTPNPAGKLGTLWDYSQRVGASVYRGTVYDNTKLGTRETIEKVVDEMLLEEGKNRESTWYRREILAEWVVELAHRVYSFDDGRNAFLSLPVRRFDHYAIIGDIGVRDADALGVLGWNDDDPTLWLVREVIRRGQDTLLLADELGALIREFDPILAALDGGGLGLKVILTLQKLFPGQPIRAVNKPPVNLQVKALNDRLHRGFRCSRESQFYAEVRKPTWVDGIVNGKIDENGHSDIVPTMRYAAVELAQLLPEAPAVVDEERQHYLEGVRRAERNAKAANATGLYDPEEFSDHDATEGYE